MMVFIQFNLLMKPQMRPQNGIALHRFHLKTREDTTLHLHR